MHHFDLNSPQNGASPTATSLAAAAAAFAAAASEQQGTVGTVSPALVDPLQQSPGLPWPHNTLMGVQSPMQSTPVQQWRLPTSYDYRNSTVSPAAAVAASVASSMQQNDFNAFAAMTPSDWSSRSNSWNQPSPKAPPASTPQQLSHLLSPNWAQSAMNQGGFVNSNPLHPQNQQNLLNSIKLEQLAALVSPGQLLNVAGNGQANGGNGGTVAEMSPVFRTPGHFNGTGIKQEYATAGLASHSGNVGNLMGGSGETGGNVSSIANNRATPEDTKPPADQIKINQNRLAALRIEEKVRAEALRLATSIPIKTPQPAQSVTPGPSLPPVSASPAPTVPELLPQAENGDEDELHKLVIADPDTETQKSESEAILPPSTTTNGTPVNRPPGLGPVEAEPGSDVFVCQVCGYTNSSRFHFNSHMNTHVDRKCVMCDYTSRTEGRLKKHMADQHTADQKAAVGYVDEMNPNGNFHENGLEELSEDVVTALDQMRALAERPTSAEPMETDALPGTSSVGDKSSPDGTPGKPKPVRKQRNKSYTCKHCKHVSLTKEERHMHSATHIPESRRLYCKLEGCSFVTGYKHHLDYHIKNHNRQKPFSCPKCKYTCVNKSMLNSHLKSHSEKYEHQCRNCNYRAKHSHSLQSHLLKYSHERYELPRTKGAQKEQNWNGDDAQVHVEASGAIGDLQSSGMLLPTTSSLNLSLLLRQAEQGSFDLSQLPGSSSFQSTLRPGPCPVCEFQCLTLQEQLHHNVTCLLASQTSLNSGLNFRQFLSEDSPNLLPTSGILGPPPVLQPQLAIQSVPEASPQTKTHDLDVAAARERERSHSEISSGSSEGAVSPKGSKKRKSKAKKCVDSIAQKLQERRPMSHTSNEDHNDDLHSPTNSVLSNNSSTTTHSSDHTMAHRGSGTNDDAKITAQGYMFVCEPCEMTFRQHSMYVIHREYHNYSNPYKCNRCGHETKDPLNFMVHTLEADHRS